MNAINDLLLAHTFHAKRPVDITRFRRITQRDGQLGGITAACFLLYDPQDSPAASARKLLFQIMPRLLPQLSRTTQPQRVLLHGRTRGRIDWSSTYKARYTQDSNPTLFVCQQSWRHFDQPENQLLKYLLKQIQVCIERVPKELLAWIAWGPSLHTGAAPLSLGNELAALSHRLRIFNSNVYLRDVTSPDVISSRQILAARTSKNELYGLIAELYDFYQAVIEDGQWDTWAGVMKHTLPLLPPNADQVARTLF